MASHVDETCNTGQSHECYDIYLYITIKINIHGYIMMI